MYVAYYGRPGDAGGITYWAERLQSSGGDWSAVIDAFGNSLEYEQRYGDLNNDSLVNSIYQQLLGREADDGGLAFYVGGLESGEFSIASIALKINNGVQNDDVMIVSNKLAVANRYTEYVVAAGADYGLGAIDAAKNLLDSVNGSDASLDSAMSGVEWLVDAANETVINEYYGTKIPVFVAEPPKDYELFDANVSVAGQMEGLGHEPTAEPGAGKFVFNRVYRAFKHGLEFGQQFGVFGSWLGSIGNNSIEGGLWVNPKVAGPHYYPTLHLAGVGDTYHNCNDVQMGSGLYERFLGDQWLTMVQISNKVLTVPGVNIAFDKDQDPYKADNGIWIGSGWTYLNLDHPRNFKYWMSFIETYDYQGPVNGYMPEHFNWIDPDKIADGRYVQSQAEYGDLFGTFATVGSRQNWGNGNERIGLKALDLGDDMYYFPVANLPNFKEREYLLAHPQSIDQDDMESYSSALKLNNLSRPLIATTVKDLTRVYESTHNQVKIVENIDGEEHFSMVVPSYKVGFDNALGYVDWDYSSAILEETQRNQNGYLYVRKLQDKWEVEEGASDEYKNHPHSYQTEIIDAPDDIVRVPRIDHQFFSYKERDTTHADFQNWDTTGKIRYQTQLQNGSTATYVWYKFIEQPAVKTAQQNHPETYTDTYLATLQTYIENLHNEINENSRVNPSDPVFINYRGSNSPDNQDPHLAKIDPAQLVASPEGFEVGYVPVVISVYHPEAYSSNGSGLIQQPDESCSNANWTDTYFPDIE